MSWKQQPAVVSAPPSEDAVRIRTRSGIAAVLFLPALFIAKVLLLATDKGGRCFVDDIACAPFPDTAFGALLVAVVLALVAAMAAPVRGARSARSCCWRPRACSSSSPIPDPRPGAVDALGHDQVVAEPATGRSDPRRGVPRALCTACGRPRLHACGRRLSRLARPVASYAA